MIKILFVCHGNICRSPMAEFIFKDLVKKAGVTANFEIASAATSREEIGNPVYPPVQRLLKKQGIDPAGKVARQMTSTDYDHYDILLGMDSYNIRNMERICGGDPRQKIERLLDRSSCPRDVADPWYTGDFEQAWRDIREGCLLLLERCRAGEAFASPNR